MSSLGELLHSFFVDKIGMSVELSNLIVIAISVTLIIIIGITAMKIIKVVIFKTLQVKKNGAKALTIAKLLSSISRYLIWFIIALLVLEELNVNITPFLASAGVLGLAIGFGAQELVKDVISGFFIIFESSFIVGDLVEIDGFKGNVLSLGLRTTVIENWRSERKTISNGRIGSIINFSKNDNLAVIEFGVGYGTDLEKFKVDIMTFLENTEKKYEDVIELPKYLGVTKLADSSINMTIICKTKTMKHFHIERDIRADLVVYLHKNNIEIPFPQMVVHNA